MSLPIVNPLSVDASPDVAKLSSFYTDLFGFCPNSVLTMQHHPELAAAFIQLNKAVMINHGRVTSALKRLLCHVSSMKTSSRYCQAFSILAAERVGANSDQLNNIGEYLTHPAFSPAERAALDFAAATAAYPNAVSSSRIEALRKYWNDEEIVEILGVVAFFGFGNRWNDSMATTIEQATLDAGNKYLAPNGWTPGKHLQAKSS